MTTRIRRNGLDYTITTFELNQFTPGPDAMRWTTEASALGLAPGQWPRFFAVTGLGNGRPFHKSCQDEGRTDYLQEFGCIRITIFND